MLTKQPRDLVSGFRENPQGQRRAHTVTSMRQKKYKVLVSATRNVTDPCRLPASIPALRSTGESDRKDGSLSKDACSAIYETKNDAFLNKHRNIYNLLNF